MSGMVFPKGPAPESIGPAAEKNTSPREKQGDSQYDSVSRVEQQKLEQRKAGKVQDKADAAVVNRPQQSETPATKKMDGELIAADSMPTEVAPEDVQALFTFADLQAWIGPVQQNVTAGTGEIAGNLPVLPPGLTTGALPGITVGSLLSGASGQSMAQVMQSLTDGLGKGSSKFAELNVSADLGRLGGGEQTHSTLNTAGAQKLPEMAPVLRGYTTSIELPVGHKEWGDKVVGKLTWLTAKNLSTAEIHLTPPDMGPMEVKVQVQQDQAHITVHSANQAVRDQLEQSSHRLRDMLSEQGVELSSFDVTDSSQNQAGQQRDTDGQTGDRMTSELADDELASSAGIMDLGWKGEIDLYA